MFPIYQARKKILNLENTQYFRPEHRKAWIELIDEIIDFALMAFIISYLFSIIEGWSLLNSIYYYFTSASTVGYGDMSPQTIAGKTLFVFGIVFYSIFKITIVAEKFIKAKSYKNQLKNLGRLFMEQKEHIVLFFNAETLSHNKYLWLNIFVKEHLKRPKFKGKNIILVNNNESYEENVILAMKKHISHKNVELINADIYEENIMEKLHIEKASQVYILSNDPKKLESDSIVYDTIQRVRGAGYQGHISCEMIDDKLRKRFEHCEQTSVIRPTRSYPEMIISTAVSPHSEFFIEEVLSHGGDTIEYFSLNNVEIEWCELVYSLSKNDIGTAISYRGTDGSFDNNPNGKEKITATGVMVLVHNMENKCYNRTQEKINSLFQ